jgi:GT2 family glycosyltransferase
MASGMVSIIIPNWNGKRYLRDCLEAIRAQTYGNFEVLLVDNASSDSSIDFVKTSFPEIRVIALPQNRGFSGAANEGIKKAKGELVALLNNDAFPEKNWLKAMVEGIQEAPDIGVCASKILRMTEESRIETAGDDYTRFGVACKRGWNQMGHHFERTEFVFAACAAAVLYRKNMLEEIGDFDEDLFFSYEDVDLSFRAQLANYRCRYVPEAVVYHLGGGTLKGRSPMGRYYGHRNLEFVFFKNMPPSLLVKYLPLHCAYLFLAFAYQVYRGQGVVFLRAKLDALRNIRKTYQKRIVIQSKRKVHPNYLEDILDSRSLLQHVKEVL